MSKIITSGVISWIVPFIFSFAFYDANQKLNVNYWIFKVSMIVVLSCTMYVLGNTMLKNNKMSLYKSSLIIIGINVLLDAIFLIGLFNQELDAWFVSILPVYIGVIPMSLSAAKSR